MVILFDGICNLCNHFVRFVIKRDRRSKFKFAALQSVYGQGLLKRFNRENIKIDSVLLYDGKNILAGTNAVIAVLYHLGGVWKVFIVCKIIPHPLRSFFYNALSKRRYTLFGKQETCMTPSIELAEKFVNETPFDGGA